MHVREEAPLASVVLGESRDQALKLAVGVVNRLQGQGVATLGEVQAAPEGRVASCILAQAQKRRTDITVMSSRALPTLGALLCGSVSQQVLKRAMCPVLIVR